MARTKQRARRSGKQKGAKPVAAARPAESAQSAEGSTKPPKGGQPKEAKERKRGKRSREGAIDEKEVSALEADAEMDVAELQRLYGAKEEEEEEEGEDAEDEGEADSADESERVKMEMSAEAQDASMSSSAAAAAAAQSSAASSSAAAAAASSSAAAAASVPASVDDDQGVQPIARFKDLHLLAPRGKYCVDLHADHFRVYKTSSDQSFSADIPFAHVRQVFLLPNQATAQHHFVVGLDPPLRQGRKGIPHLIVQFADRTPPVSMSFNIDEQACLERYGGAMQPRMDGPERDVFSSAFEALSGVDVALPGGFRTSEGGTCVPCNTRTQSGFLFFMADALLFMPRPLLHLPLSQVLSVAFRRVSRSLLTGSKTFDVHVTMRGRKKGDEIIFGSIRRAELDPIVQFLQDKSVALTRDDVFDASGKRKRAGADGDGLDQGEERSANKKQKRQRDVKGAFGLFWAEAHAAYQSEHPDQRRDQMRRALRDQFHALGEEGRAKYNEAAQRIIDENEAKEAEEEGDEVGESKENEEETGDSAGRQAHKRKRSDGDDSPDGEEGEESQKKKQKKKKQNPLNDDELKEAYGMFCNKKRWAYMAEHPDANKIQVRNAMRSQWQALDAAERAKFAEMIDQKREKRNRDLRAAMGVVEEEEQEDEDEEEEEQSSDSADEREEMRLKHLKKHAKKLERKAKRQKKEEKKLKHGVKLSYLHYLDEARPQYAADHPEVQDTTSAHVNAILSAQWKALGVAGRAKYRQMAQAARTAMRAERTAAHAARVAAAAARAGAAVAGNLGAEEASAASSTQPSDNDAAVKDDSNDNSNTSDSKHEADTQINVDGDNNSDNDVGGSKLETDTQINVE